MLRHHGIQTMKLMGRWLSGLKGVDSKKAELVGEILLNDMRFHPGMNTKRESPNYYNYIIPTVGAWTGCAISMYLDYGKLVQAGSTIIPAVLLNPAVTKRLEIE